MLRAVRFAARLGFEIEPRTMAAIRAAAAEIGQVSCERIRDELTLMSDGGRMRGGRLSCWMRRGCWRRCCRRW